MAYSSFLTISMDRIRLIRSRALIEKLACLVKYSSQDVCYRTLLTNLLGTGIMIVHLDPKYRHNCLLIIISHTYTPTAHQNLYSLQVCAITRKIKSRHINPAQLKFVLKSQHEQSKLPILFVSQTQRLCEDDPEGIW